MKSLSRSAPVRRALAFLISGYLRLVLRTNRWTFDGAENFAPHRRGAPAVCAFWHEFLPLMPALRMLARRAPDYTAAPIHTLVSQHRDGRLIGQIVRSFGIEPVHGSSSRGGAAGLRRLLDLLRGGAMIGITPDGPRGPCYEVKPGAVIVARRTRAPMLLVGGEFTTAWRLGSWDRFYVPAPFSRVRMRCELITVDQLADRDSGIALVRDRLLAINPDQP